MRRTMAAALVGAAMMLTAAPSGAQQGTFVQGAPQGTTVRQLLDELNGLIEKAERNKAATPAFLRQLRTLEDKYGSVGAGTPSLLLVDDFKQKLSQNPRWTVGSGKWEVDRKGDNHGLHSIVAIQEGAPNGMPPAILGPAGWRTTASPVATIAAPVAIPGSFAVRLQMRVESERGSFAVGPYQGVAGAFGYRLVYTASPSPVGLALYRMTPQGPVRLAARPRPLDLADGRFHTLELTRSATGAMQVRLDGGVAMAAQDPGPAAFDGLLIVNGGGDYYISSVQVTGSR